MNSKTYWQQREEEALKHYITDEAAYDKQIKRIYTNMLDSIQSEINAFYGKYASAEGITLAEAKKRVSALDIAAYERKAKRYVKNKDFSKQANEEMRLYNATMKINRLEMLKANIGLELIAGHDELEKFMADILQGRTVAELERQAGILGETIRNNAKTANAIVNGSFHNGTFSDRIWQYQDIMRNDLGKLLQTGLIQGKNARALTKDLHKYLVGDKTGKGATYNVERLMRTELARVQTEAQKQSFEQNGFLWYTFHANVNPSKSHTCDICRGLDGKHFKVADMMPGTNAPPMHPHCRCSTSAYEDSAEYDAWLEQISKGKAATIDHPKKKKAQSAEQQVGQKPQSSFVPAKTLQEAEAFAKQFVDANGFGAVGVSYNGVHLDVANAVNHALSDVFNLFDIPKLGGIAAPAKNTKLGKMVNAHAAYSTIRKSILMDRNKAKKASTMLDGLMEDKKAITNILAHPERYDFNKLGTRLRKIIEASSETGRSIVAENITEAITHELGHHIERSVSAADWDIVKHGMEKYATKISGYCVDSPSEYFAESFTAYMKGENCIDPALGAIFDKMRK